MTENTTPRLTGAEIEEMLERMAEDARRTRELIAVRKGDRVRRTATGVEYEVVGVRMLDSGPLVIIETVETHRRTVLTDEAAVAALIPVVEEPAAEVYVEEPESAEELEIRERAFHAATWHGLPINRDADGVCLDCRGAVEVRVSRGSRDADGRAVSDLVMTFDNVEDADRYAEVYHRSRGDIVSVVMPCGHDFDRYGMRTAEFCRWCASPSRYSTAPAVTTRIPHKVEAEVESSPVDAIPTDLDRTEAEDLDDAEHAAVTAEVVAERVAELAELDEDEYEDDDECDGHESLRGDLMGAVFYCDGSCRRPMSERAERLAEVGRERVRAAGPAPEEVDPAAELARILRTANEAHVPGHGRDGVSPAWDRRLADAVIAAGWRPSA